MVEESRHIDEALLVNSCKNNEFTAQHILYNKYAGDMMSVCKKYVDNHEDAREVLMDGFLSFFRNIGNFTYHGVGSVKAWLKKIVVNQCLMHLRKRKAVGGSEPATVEYEDKESHDNVLDKMRAKEIMKLLSELPDGYRMVFTLYVFEGMNHKQISDILNISENTSKSQLHRARALLKERILELN